MKTKTILVLVFLISLIGIIIYQYYQNKKLSEYNQQSNQPFKTDTIYKKETIKIPELFSIYIEPKVITYYEKDTTSKYTLFSLREKDLVLTSNTDLLDSILISKIFLNTHIFNPKLLFLSISSNKLNLGLMDINGTTHEDQYILDLSQYNYQYVGNKLTSKKVNRVKLYPEIGYTYRPLNKLHDIDLSINFKTTRINYKVGLNGFYYPSFQKNPGWDFVLGISYKF